MSPVRLLQGNDVLEDNRKLCEYSLQEGATLSALFELDVDINIEVSTVLQEQNITISNSTAIKALKVKICQAMRCGVAPQKLEIRPGDITLEEQMPLHFHGIKNGSKLEVVKPYVAVTVENNYGTEILWRIDRQDTIRGIKSKLAGNQSQVPMTYYHVQESYSRIDNEINIFNGGRIIFEAMRLYIIREDGSYDELGDDDETVDKYDIKDGDNLYLLTSRWVHNCNVTVIKTGRRLRGVDEEDTCLGIKMKAQDQLGKPVSEFKLFQAKGASVQVKDYYSETQTKDQDKPFRLKRDTVLILVTAEEMKVECIRIEEEKREEERRDEERKQREAVIPREHGKSDAVLNEYRKPTHEARK